MTSLREQIRYISTLAREDLPENFRDSLGCFNEVLDEHVYHVAMMRHASDGFDLRGAMVDAKVEPKVKVLHTIPSVPFITCDNPARPYKPNQLRESLDRPLPGLRDPSVHILYPISPLSCIVISSNRSWRAFVHQSASVSSVKAINTALAIMADEQIIFAGPNVSVFQEWLKLDKIRPLSRP